MVDTIWKQVKKCLVFEWHSKTGPFENQTTFDHLKMGHVHFPNPHWRCSQKVTMCYYITVGIWIGHLKTRNIQKPNILKVGFWPANQYVEHGLTIQIPNHSKSGQPFCKNHTKTGPIGNRPTLDHSKTTSCWSSFLNALSKYCF